jgi:hypothetical protein
MIALRTALGGSAIAAAFLLGLPARAQIVNYSPLFPGLYPTGFAANGNEIGTVIATSTSEGTIDPHYSVVAVSTFVSSYTKYEGAAYATSTATGWHAPVNGSGWIEPRGGVYSAVSGNPEYWFPSSGSAAPKGVQYDYQIVFTVPTSFALSTLTIAGSLAADDYVDLYLNGNTSHELALSGASLSTSGAAFSLTSANGLIIGVNTLTFAVFNVEPGQIGASTSPSGIDVFAIGTGTYTTLAAPEVGAVIPVAVAVALYAGMFLVHRRTRLKAGIGRR